MGRVKEVLLEDTNEYEFQDILDQNWLRDNIEEIGYIINGQRTFIPVKNIMKINKEYIRYKASLHSQRYGNRIVKIVYTQPIRKIDTLFYKLRSAE